MDVAKKRTPVLIPGQEVRAQLSRLLEGVAIGQQVLITKHGQPVAAIVGMPDYQQLSMLTSSKENNMKVISIYNQAGGAGKTTVTRDVGYAFSQKGLKVLLIDLDTQASLTRWLGLLTETAGQPKPLAAKLDRTVCPVLLDADADLPEPLEAFGMHIIPANSKLAVGDSVLYDDQNRINQLRLAIRRLVDYDIVLIDAPPGRTAMAMAAVAASDYILIPVNASKALDNINNVAEILQAARKFSPKLKILAFVPHSVIPNTNHHKDVLRTLRVDLARLAPTTTPISYKATLYSDATIFQQPIAVYAPKNSPKAEYNLLADEILALVNISQVKEVQI